MQTEKSVVESGNRYDKLCAENKSGYDGEGLESSARTEAARKQRNRLLRARTDMTSCVQKTNLVTMAEDWRAVQEQIRLNRDKQCASENRYDKLCAENKLSDKIKAEKSTQKKYSSQKNTAAKSQSISILHDF